MEEIAHTRARDTLKHDTELCDVARVLLFLKALIDEIPCKVS